VCLIASADLAHVGPQFGDRRPLSPATLSLAESEDRKMLRHAEELDAEGFYHAVAGDHDARHICGLPPIYVLLRTISASEGKLLKYAQAADPSGQGCVSFAAMAFS
jgi:AmmeMemoRadiSam system protein B